MIKPRLRSLYMAILKEANIVITVLTALSILHLRSAHSLWFGLGAIMASVIAKVLKRCIKQPRPTESTKKSFGMPSTHSSSITFYGTYLLLVCLLLPIHQRMTGLLPGTGTSRAASEGVHPRTRNNQKDELYSWTHTPTVEPVEGLPSLLSTLLRLLYGSIFILIALVVCWSRIKFGHHTLKQVVAGAVIGAMIGVVWFGIWTGFKIPKAVLLEHHYYHGASEPLPNGEHAELLTVKGIGPYLEDTLSRISITFAEAWYMRDFSLIWDSLIRPTLNHLGFLFGVQHRLFDNGLPPNSNLHLIQPPPDSSLHR